MNKFAKKDRQRIIDDYLAQSGRNMFIPAEFIDWLADKPEHEAYELFYGMDDSEAARQHRIGLARKMASGLRIVVTQEQTAEAQVVHITTREYPAYVSPLANRTKGGGYVPFNAQDPQAAEDLRMQGAQALRSWLVRYRGVAELAGIDLEPMEDIVAQLSQGAARSA